MAQAKTASVSGDQRTAFGSTHRFGKGEAMGLPKSLLFVFGIASGLAALTGVGLRASAQTSPSWSTPVNLGATVNTASTEGCPFLSKDGLSLYFASNRAGTLGGLDIYVSHRTSVDAPWGTPVTIGPTINSTASDRCPLITPDEKSLIFVSDRAGGAGNTDLYIATRTDTRDDFGWGTPTNIFTINTSSDEYGPSAFTDAAGTLTLFFTSNRPGGLGGFDIYSSVRAANGIFGDPALVTELSSSADDTFPLVRNDGLAMFLASNRPGTLGGFDLWSATRSSTTAPWSAPVNLGSVVNSTANEQRPTISSDGTTIIFMSDRPGGFGGFDLYATTLSAAKAPAPPNTGTGIARNAGRPSDVFFPMALAGAAALAVGCLGLGAFVKARRSALSAVGVVRSQSQERREG
jgi:Tol biopolymer transport system component